MKTRLHKKQQNCNKLLTLFTMGIAMLTGVVAIGFATIRESYHQARAFSYDDTSTTIVLNADELNNVQFNNLHTYLDSINDSDLEFTQIEYLEDTLDFVYTGEGYPFSYSGADYTIHLLDSNNKFVLGEGALFTTSINFVLNETTYSYVKQAIEQDIASNQPSDNMPSVLTDFVQILVNGIGQMASGVASGISAMAQALFLKVENGAVVGLSVFGGILAIFAGLALAVAITTKVYLWITSLGN